MQLRTRSLREKKKSAKGTLARASPTQVLKIIKYKIIKYKIIKYKIIKYKIIKYKIIKYFGQIQGTLLVNMAL